MKRWGMLVAAGQSRRMGPLGSKLWLQLHGQSALSWGFEHFIGSGGWDGGVVVCRPEEGQEVSRLLAAYGYRDWGITNGGPWRHASVKNGLRWLADHGMGPDDLVLIHDAARILVDQALIMRVYTAAAEYHAAIPVIPLVDTVKRVADGTKYIERTEDRTKLVLAQTPQGFRSALIQEAYIAWGDGVPTDEAQVVEQFGHPVVLVGGDLDNRKLTTAEDVAWFEWRLKQDDES